MLQNPCKTLGFIKSMVYKIAPGSGGKAYLASGLIIKIKIRNLDDDNNYFSLILRT